MPITIRLSDMTTETNFAPLGVLGYCLTRSNFFSPIWSELDLGLKTVEHAPEAKLQDVLVSILAGCRAISEVNTRLRPDIALARSWGRERFAEQSMLARTLDSCGVEQVQQFQQGSQIWLRKEGQTFKHSFEQDWLYLDMDLSPLPCSKMAQGSTKGKFAKKTATVVNWLGLKFPNITKRFFHGFIQANRRVVRLMNLC